MAFLEHKPTATLYHYTSPDGFLGIIQSKRLWFSDLANSNDPRELQLGLARFIEALDSVRRNEFRGSKGEFVDILKDRLSIAMSGSHLYCCCFSDLDDSLPMWRAYGEECSGLALGFRPTALFGIDGRIQKVKYLNDDIEQGLRNLALNIAAEAEALHLPAEAAYWVIPSTGVLAAITSLKHSSWSYERETRMVHSQITQKLSYDDESYLREHGLISGPPLKWTAPLNRTARGGPVSYLEFDYGRLRGGKFEAKAALEEIVIGPNCAISIADAGKSLRDNGFENFKVRKSDCQIR